MKCRAAPKYSLYKTMTSKALMRGLHPTTTMSVGRSSPTARRDETRRDETRRDETRKLSERIWKSQVKYHAQRALFAS
ncbi:hypothetical protein CCP4SC76_6590001 [Gammaproteobacteria bacterium]